MKRIVEQSCDCLVIGGGTAGVVAALQAARAGVRVVNASSADPLVMLKHFGPENPQWARQFA